MDSAEFEDRLFELERRLANVVLIGTIIDADYDKARVKVKTGDVTTAWLPWQVHRAGATIEWWAPEIGEQVTVLSPGGDLALGVVSMALYSTANPPPSTDPKIRRTNYGDGSYVEYDETAHKMTVTVNGGDVVLNATGNLDAAIGGNAEIVAEGEANVTANNINLDGAGGSALFGTVNGGCACLLSGNPHAQISATVKTSL